MTSAPESVEAASAAPLQTAGQPSDPRVWAIAALARGLRDSSTLQVVFSHAVADELGLNATDMECLGLLADAGPVTAGRLAELAGLTTGAITGVVDRLERAGYVSREPDPSDRRKVIVRPVEQRLAAIHPLFQPISHAVGEIIDSYSDADLALLADFVQRVNAVLRDQAAARGAASASQKRRAIPSA